MLETINTSQQVQLQAYQEMVIIDKLQNSKAQIWKSVTDNF